MVTPGVKLEILALVSIMCLSTGAFFWGLNGDSPVCSENDELCFAEPALQMVLKHDPNPHTFISPASTFIYPLAAYYAILDQITNHKYIDHNQPPWLLCSQKMEGLIKWPRLANVVLILGTLILLYLAGRSWVGKPAALLAILFYSLAPMIVYYGQILRPDTLNNFFICLDMFLLGLCCSAPTDKKRAAELGICTGLATSTRYFCVALVPAIFTVYAVSLFGEKNREHRKAVLASLLIALLLWLVTFFCSSPFVFLDFHQVVSDLAFEAKSEFSGIAGLGPIGNLKFYFTMAFPQTLGVILTSMSGIGLVFLLARPNKITIVNTVLLLVILIGTCLNPRHWDRWVIPMLPIMCLLAGYAISSGYHIFVRLLKWKLPARVAHWLSLGACISFSAYALFFPFRNMLCLEKQKGDLSGRAKAFYFIKEHIPKHTKIACDMSWDWPDRDDYIVLQDVWRPDFVPPRSHNYYLPEDLAKDGYQFLIVQRWNREDYSLLEPKKYPREAKFYISLRKHAPMLFTSYTRPRPQILGEQVEERFTPVEIYDLRPIAKGIYPKQDYRPQDAY